VLTLVLVPVLYSLISRFTGARTNDETEMVLEEAAVRRVGVST
jgi:hypothetical protein